jgi:hypothetical protein
VHCIYGGVGLLYLPVPQVESNQGGLTHLPLHHSIGLFYHVFRGMTPTARPLALRIFNIQYMYCVPIDGCNIPGARRMDVCNDQMDPTFGLLCHIFSAFAEDVESFADI